MSGKTIACPHCGCSFKEEQFIEAGQLAEYVRLVANFGRGAIAVLDYIELFRSQSRGLPVAKRIRLLTELSPLWERNTYQFGGCTYQIDHSEIVEALRVVANRDSISIPLQNHNYLKKVMHAAAQAVAAQREQEREEQRRERTIPANKPFKTAGNRPDFLADLPPEIREQVEGLQQEKKFTEAMDVIAKFKRRGK